MTLDPLSSASSALPSLSGVSPTAGAVAAAGARSLALGVAGEVGRHLLAPLSGQGAPPQPRPYEIQAQAEAIGQALGATPMEVMDLEGALQALAGAVASDFFGLADGRTFDRLEHGLSAAGAGLGEDGPATPAAVSRTLHDLAAHIAASS